MLEGLRVASQNWFGRIVMGLVMGFIAITFAIWGVGDVFRGFTSHRLARVGAGEVTVEAYKANYQNELRHLQQRLRRAITNEEARAAGLDLQILERLVTDVALDQQAQSLGLAMSDDSVQKIMRGEKAFQKPNGEFDPERFKAIANDAGFSERGFIQDQKAVYLRKALTDAVIEGVEPPRLMVEAIYRFRNEARAVDYFVLPAAAAGAAPTPSDEELKKYFADREQSFRAKEYRKLTILAATPTSLAKPAAVTDEELRKFYDEVKTKRYGAPEKREVRQIVFKTGAEAEAALARLKGGLAFEALIAELKLNPKDAHLGLIEQRDIGDRKLAAAVFAQPAPGLAAPVTTPFGTVVSEVTRIVPGVYSKSFEQAAPELRTEIAAQRAAPEARRLRDAVEEQRASGKTLAEAAKSLGLETRIIDAVDDVGADKSGLPIADIPANLDLLKAAFASDVGVDNDIVATRDGGYVWFEVGAIEPARQKTFEEVKGAVAAAMAAEGGQKALAAKAEEIVAKLRSGKPIDDAAKELSLDVKRAVDIKRAARPDFAAATIVQFFEVPMHGAGSVPVEGGRLVFFVKEAATPKFDPASIEAKTIAEQLKPALHNDLLEQYVGGVEKILGVDINQNMLKLATGAEAEK